MTVIYAGLIFYFSSLSDLPFLRNHAYFINYLIGVFDEAGLKFMLAPFYLARVYPDKFLHAVVYFGFGILLYLTFANSKYPVLVKYPFLLAIVIGTIYGATDEFHQSFVPGRTMSTGDLLADALGLAASQVFVLLAFIVLNISRRFHHEFLS
ncbi:MAG TPA: hypothetical protein HA257_07995 [Candidatus Methanoperedenaceae archaeon]|nr:hypothetical protein [Candidatus Methanoperedenaceae archaeon]